MSLRRLPMTWPKQVPTIPPIERLVQRPLLAVSCRWHLNRLPDQVGRQLSTHNSHHVAVQKRVRYRPEADMASRSERCQFSESI
jgi:hypothetical protein